MKRSTSKARLREYAPVLRLLCSCKRGTAKSIIKDAPVDLIKTLDDCSKNVLTGRVPLSTSAKKRLCQYKRQLRALNQKKLSVTARRKYFQHGGFLGAVLKPVLAALGGILGL